MSLKCPYDDNADFNIVNKNHNKNGLSMVVTTVNIRQLRNTAFSNMYNLCMKELLVAVSIVRIRLNGKAAFSDMCNNCMK